MTPDPRPLGHWIALLTEAGLLSQPVSPDPSIPITLICDHSQQVEPGTLFVCKGAHFQPSFLMQAQNRGAVAYVSQQHYPQSPLPALVVSDIRRAMALLADQFYQHPSGQLSVIGITGTKGKSSVAYLLKGILDAWQQEQGAGETGLLSSIHTYDGLERFESHLTTPEPLPLQRHLFHGVQAGLHYFTMEVSSQALKYHRTLYTQFAVGCFLNIGVDHISPVEHPNFQDYLTSKLALFSQSHCNCVNLDCPHQEVILQAAQQAGKPLYTFSQHQETAHIYGHSIRKEYGQTVFQGRTPRYEREFRLSIPGLFNVENALAVLALCEALQVPPHIIYQGLVSGKVPGRMEVYSNIDGSLHVIVDYAHNQLSFETLFHSVQQEYPGHSISIVFGCPGGKAVDRRRDLGIAAGTFCHHVYLTEEDSGSEDTLSICQEIAPYVIQGGCTDLHLIPNRGEAIRQAILDCQGPSVVLLTGKGRETRQKRGELYVQTPSDVDYAQAFLQEYDLCHPPVHAKVALSLLPNWKQALGQQVVVFAPASQGTLSSDLAALHQSGLSVVLVSPEPVPSLGAMGVTLQPADGGLVTCNGGQIQVNPKLVSTLLSAHFLPILQGDVQIAAALAQSLPAHRLILLTPHEPSLALGLNRQGELLHMDCGRALELIRQGQLPASVATAMSTMVESIAHGVSWATLLSWETPHGLLLELLGQQIMGLSIHP